MRYKRIQSLLASICARAAVCAFSLWLVMSPVVMADITWSPGQPNPHQWPDWLGFGNGINTITVQDERGANRAAPAANNNTGTLIAGAGGWGVGVPPAGTIPTDLVWGSDANRKSLTIDSNCSSTLWIANNFGMNGAVTINGNSSLTVLRVGTNVTRPFSVITLTSIIFGNSGSFTLADGAALTTSDWFNRNLFVLTAGNRESAFTNNRGASVSNADAWQLQASRLNNSGSISGATNWLGVGSRITNLGGTISTRTTDLPTTGWAWYLVGSTLDNSFEGDYSATINLGTSGRMFLIGSTLNAIGSATDFNGSSRGTRAGSGPTATINGKEVLLSGTGPMSSYSGAASEGYLGNWWWSTGASVVIDPIQFVLPAGLTYSIPLDPPGNPGGGVYDPSPLVVKTLGGGGIWGGHNNATGFRWFNVAGETGGTADLRFATLESTFWYTYNLIGGTITPTITLDRWRDNKTVIRATSNARITNPRMFLDGTYGRTAYRLQLDSIIPNQNQNDPTQLTNKNLLYNIIRTQGEGVQLGITSDIHIARIAPEWSPLNLNGSTTVAAPTIPSLVLDYLPVNATGGTPVINYTERDYAYLFHNPTSPFYYGKPTLLAAYPLPDGTTIPAGTANPWYNSSEYNAAWDPTNNPNSPLYKYTNPDPLIGSKYNAFYDPSAAVHNAGNATADYYNPKFDRSSPNYNTASWYGGGVGYLANAHIAYNPYLDANGYSGGLTKVDNGLLWIQTARAGSLAVMSNFSVATGFTRTGAQMNRDINSLIDVQGGILRFNRQEDLRPVWKAATEGLVFNAGTAVEDNPTTNQYAPFQRYNVNPNGYIAAGQVAADKSNYYTIQLNTLSNPNGVAARNATVLSTSGGHHYRTDPSQPNPLNDPLRNRATNDNRLTVNNRIVLHGGGTFDVGYLPGTGAYWYTVVNGEYVEDDSLYRNYTTKSAQDNESNIQGGGVGNYMGYLWLNNATLVGERATENVTPFLNKTGVGVLDLTGVNWEYEQGLTNVELNVVQGTLAFTNQPDLGSGRIALEGRDAILAILKDSELDRGSIVYDPTQPNNTRLVSGFDTNWGIAGPLPLPANRQILNPNAGTSEINNIIVLSGGGTINVVQGGRPPAVGSLIFPQPFYSEYDITKTRAGDGYENQHNLIIHGSRISGTGALRKIGLGMLTIEGDYRVARGTVSFPVRIGQIQRDYENVQFELQRGTLRFSKETNLGGIAGGAAGGTILFSLDKNATLQYYGKDQEMVVRNNITMTYDRGLYNSGGATIDIRNTEVNGETLMTTLRLTGTIMGDSNFLTITKLGQLKSVLDMTRATMTGTAGAAKWDVRTGELAFDVSSNIGGGDITLSEATTLHKVYAQPSGTPAVSPNTKDVTITNNIIVRNNATINVDGNAKSSSGVLAQLTLSGDLSVQTQLDKMGDGILILNGSLANMGAADTTDINPISPTFGVHTLKGGLRIKEGKLEFSRLQQLKTLAGASISINLYGSETGLVYSGIGDTDPNTRKPRPLVIDNNINILPLYHNLDTSPRVANITVTDVTGNLAIAGEQLRGGDLVLNDLQRDADGNPMIGADGKWLPKTDDITSIKNINGVDVLIPSTLVKDGLGTLTLSGTLNGDPNESIALLIKQGKIAFSQQSNLGNGTIGSPLNNAITFNGVNAKLEYLGTTAGANTITIENKLHFINGGGTLSVLEANDTFKLTNQITATRDLTAINETAPYNGATWTLAKEGAGKLDITDVSFRNALNPTEIAVGKPALYMTNLDIKDGTVVFNKQTNLTSTPVTVGTVIVGYTPLDISMGSIVPGVSKPGVVTSYTTYTSGILEYTGVSDTYSNKITLNGGKVVSSATGLPIYDQLTGKQVVAGGGINVVNAGTDLTWTGAISGTGSFTKSGEGTLTLGNANRSLTGDVIVERGNLVLTTQQQFQGDIIVKNFLNGAVYEGNTLVAEASDVISYRNKLYLASGTTFDMSYVITNPDGSETPTTQTLTGVMTLPIASAGASRILVSADCTTLVPDPNGGDPKNIDVGNTLRLELDEGTTWRVGQIVGNDNSTIIYAKGYILVDDLSHFHGKQLFQGGTVIGGGSADAGTSHTLVNSFEDKGEWTSCNVTMNNSHITVGFNPTLATNGGFWASCNVKASDRSTIDVATDWVTSSGVDSQHYKDIRSPNVIIEGNSRISVQGNWQESGDILVDNSKLFVGGEWRHYAVIRELNPNFDPNEPVSPTNRRYRVAARRWVDGLYDTRDYRYVYIDEDYGFDFVNANPGYASDYPDVNYVHTTLPPTNPVDGATIYWNQDTGTVSNFVARDKDGTYKSVTATNGSTVLLSGNGTSGVLSLSGSTLTVGHVVGGELAAGTGNYTVTLGTGIGADATFTNNSTATILGSWKSGNLTLSGNSSLTVGHVTGTGAATRLTINTGEFETLLKDGKAGTVENGFVSVGAGSDLTIYGDMTSGNVNVLGEVSVGLWDSPITPGQASVPLSNGRVNIDGSLFVSGTFRNAGMLKIKAVDTIPGNLVANGGRITVGADLEVEENVALLGGSNINVARNWTSGEVLVNNSVIYVGSDLKTHYADGTPAKFEARNKSTINVIENLATGDTWLYETTTTVGSNFTATSLIVQGEVAGSNDNLKVGGTLKVGITDASGKLLSGGPVTIAANTDPAARATYVNIGKDWESGKVTTTGRNVDVTVGGNFTSGSITSDGGRFTILKSLTAAGDGTPNSSGNVSTSGVLWDVAGDWTSDATTISTASTFKVGGDFYTRDNDVRLAGVQEITIGGNIGKLVDGTWHSIGTLTLTGGNSKLSVTGNLLSSAITSDGGSFTIGGNLVSRNSDNIDTKVTTRGANWQVGGDWTSGDIDIRNAGYFRVGGDWDNATSAAKFVDVERIEIGKDKDKDNWHSSTLSLSTLGNETSPPEVRMEVAGSFNPGRELTFDMPKGRSPLALDPIYRITANSVELAGTTIAVSNAGNLSALGKYHAARISTRTGNVPLPTELTIDDNSLFKRVIAEQPTLSVLDIYVNATGFSGYVARLGEFGIGGITHNQLEVIKNMTRVEQQITSFETAAAADRENRLITTTSALNEPPMMSSLRSNSMVTDVLVKLIEYGDNNNTSVAERAANINHALNELTGDTQANAMAIASTRPWMEAYDRLRMDNEMYFVGDNYVASSQTMRGQSARLARMNRLWITPSYTFDSISSDGNARAADIGRAGFSFGLDRRIRHNATAGIMFNYNSARLKQDEDRVEGNDFGVSLYAGAMLGYYFELRSFLGCGWQNYESTRVFDTTFAGGNRQNASGRADGHSISGSVEVARPLFFGMFIFKPTLGLDITSYTRNAFDETGDAIALRIGRTTYTRVSPRIGATWEAGTMNRFAITTRFFAGYNLADEYITAQTQFVTIGGSTQDIRSVALGRGFIDAGIGARYYLNNARSMSLHGNADIITSKRSFAGAVSGGMSWLY